MVRSAKTTTLVISSFFSICWTQDIFQCSRCEYQLQNALQTLKSDSPSINLKRLVCLLSIFLCFVYTKRSGHFCSIISVLFEEIPIAPDISVFTGDYINYKTSSTLNMKHLLLLLLTKVSVNCNIMISDNIDFS